ncbi:MAG: hypothetical protein EOM64_06295 [Erysipelotrichia bacterium]|nr:hypothetical protein [Erysipelotrichia bacterium]
MHACTAQVFLLLEEIQEVLFMRHFYFRLALGIVFLGCMIYCFAITNIKLALMYLLFSAALLFSAYTLRKKDANHQR